MPAETKFFQVRDRGTNTPVMCVRFHGSAMDGRPGEIARRAGWGSEPATIYIKLASGEAAHDLTDWSDRTNLYAHAHICDHWEELGDGAVIDVEFILGESETAKEFQ